MSQPRLGISGSSKSLDQLQWSAEWEETDAEAREYDARIAEEISWKESSVGNALYATSAPYPSAARTVHEVLNIEQLLPVQSTSDQPEQTIAPLPSFHPSHIVHTSTPRIHPTATFPDVLTPTQTTPALPKPAEQLSRAGIALQRSVVATQAEDVPSPIDTPSSSRMGEGRGRRDEPATPLSLGTALFSKFRGKKDLQTLTTLFEAFQKTEAKKLGGSDAKIKGKGTKLAQKGTVVVPGFGGRVFDGLRFCIPPEIGQASKHKLRWDVVSVQSALYRS